MLTRIGKDDVTQVKGGLWAEGLMLNALAMVAQVSSDTIPIRQRQQISTSVCDGQRLLSPIEMMPGGLGYFILLCGAILLGAIHCGGKLVVLETV